MPFPRFAPPLGLSAAGLSAAALAAVALSGAWAAAPEPATPAPKPTPAAVPETTPDPAGPAGVQQDSTLETLVVRDAPPGMHDALNPFRDPVEAEIERRIDEAIIQANHLAEYEHAPLPPGTDRDALRDGTPERDELLNLAGGDGTIAGDHAAVMNVVPDGDGWRVTLLVSRPAAGEVRNPRHPQVSLFERWRVGPEGTTEYLGPVTLDEWHAEVRARNAAAAADPPAAAAD